VELPGIKNPDEIINIVRRTGKLEFRLVDEQLSLLELERKIAKVKEDLKLDKVYEDVALQKLNEALKADLPEGTEVLFSLERNTTSKEVTKATPYLVTRQADVTGDMLENAKVESQNNLPYVSMSFNKTGAKKFGDLTSANVGRQLAIVLDNVVMSAPVIRTAITGGQAQIELGYGRFDALHKEATELVLILREGALPASLAVATKNIIGPSLGKESIAAGLNSILISALGVVLFMVLYYRAGGMIANVALFLNVVFIFAILCLFQASLTLPGMAGIVLTVGMAVDANVIIFERMREEIFLGKAVREVIDSAYSHANSAIIDGNITTFIAGLVLFEFGTGPIKGFATTLMIGIITTLFTAITVSRMIYDGLVDSQKMKSVGFS
jgi:protein-export membrane protein SecD